MSTKPISLPFLDPAFKAKSPSLCREFGGNRSLIRVRLPSGIDAWVTLGHGLARTLLRDEIIVKRKLNTRNEHIHPIFRHMLTFDPPEHTRLRAALSAAMPPERVRMLRSEIETITHDLVIQLLTHGEKPFDLITELALPLSIRVIARLLGIPPSDEPLIQSWSMKLLHADLEASDQINAIADDINTYLVALANEKRLAPDESIMSSFIQMKQPEALISEEISAMSFLLLTAGHETSVNLITNGAMNLLCAPNIWRRLCADLSLAGAVTEEILRFESPLEFATPRYAAADVVVDGQKICRGDLVFVGIGAANRDPLVFDDPNTFDIDRKNNARHIAFGQGVHACPGAHLARLEGEIVFAQLANYLPNLELALDMNELEWIPGIVMRGLIALNVRNKQDNMKEGLSNL